MLGHKDAYDQYYQAANDAGAGKAVNIQAIYIGVLACPSDPPDTAGPGQPILSYVVNRGRNGWNFDPSVGVCFDQCVQYEYSTGNLQPSAVQPPAKVGIDYLTSHDGSATTLLVAESLLTPNAYVGQLTPPPTTGQPPLPPPYMNWFSRNRMILPTPMACRPLRDQPTPQRPRTRRPTARIPVTTMCQE